MDRFKLFESGINTMEGINRFGGNAQIYEKYLLKFVDDVNFSKLCDAIKSGDVKAAFSSAHTLKGIVGNLSMDSLYDHLFPLVEQLRGGSLENVDTMLKQVEEDYKKVIDAISNE